MHTRSLMKLMILMVAVSLVLAGCGQPAPEATEAPATEAPAEEPTEEPAEEGAAACPASTVADPMGVPAGEWPQQYDLSEFEELAACEMTFKSREMFHERLWEVGTEFFGKPMLEGDLPPTEERLPDEPMVVPPYETIGNYGGRARFISYGPESGNSEFLSVRHENLVRFLDDCDTIVPNVAKHYEVSDDNTIITFWLREGHKWSDGAPFTVDDILFWWRDHMLNEELFPTVPSQWVFGGEPLEMEKIDDYTFEIRLAAPVADSLLTWLAKTWIQPWKPKHFLEEHHVRYNPDIRETAKEEGFEDWASYYFANCFGNWQDSVHQYGLPKLESHILVEETTEYKTFVANPYYFKVDTAGNQLPYLDEIYQSYGDYPTFEQKIINGEIDYKAQSLGLGSLPLFKEHQEQGDFAMQMAPGVTMGPQFTFNCTHQDPMLLEIFQNPTFKEAMSLAIDRQEISDAVYYGLAEPQQYIPVHPSASFAEEEWYTYKTEYDPERAEELLDEIGLSEKDSDGFRLRPDGQRLVVNNVYCTQGTNPDLVELVKAYWEDVGIKVNMKEVSTEAYRTLVSSNEHDIASFTSGGVWEPMLRANPYRLVPPFGDAALEPLCGGPWYEWYNSDGESGEEPPEDVKQLFDLVTEWKGTLPGTEEYEDLGKQIIEIHRDNFWYVGTVSDAPRITVIHNRLANVPEISYQDWDVYRTYPYQTAQWFIKEEYLSQ